MEICHTHLDIGALGYIETLLLMLIGFFSKMTPTMAKLLFSAKGHLHYVMSLVDKHHETSKGSPNMHARDLVYISKYCHCHCESIDMQTMFIAFIAFVLSGSMPHGNNYGSLNMQAIDIVDISIESQWQWQYFEI